MSKTTVRVVARLVALPGKVEELKLVMMGLIEQTRKEDGCISVEMLQNQDDPTEFTFVDEWQNATLLDAHIVSPHIQETLPKLYGLLAAEPDVRRYRWVA